MDDPAQVASVAAMMDDTRQEHGMSEVRTLTLTEFLTARLDEDEAAAMRGRSHPDPTAYANDNYGYLWVQPERVLAEVEAKRRIVALYQRSVRAVGDGLSATQRLAVQHLASVYSDHPDFNPDWRP